MLPEPVKLYVGPDYKEPKLFTHIELMFPFWGVTAKESMPYVRAAALQYQYSKDDFTLIETIADADYVVIPYNYERLKAVNPERLRMIIADAQKAGKPLLIDGSGDIEHPIDIPGAVVLRVSQYRYSMKRNEITIPFVSEDLMKTYMNGIQPLRQKRERPSIGFTGWTSISLVSRLKAYYKELPILASALFDRQRFAEHKGIFFRQRALRALTRDQRIDANITARATYSGHVATVTGFVEDNRRQFVDSLRDCDYALCVKGDANASVRFYEALSLGRIPLFVDTACVLPLETEINYRDFCVFVDWRDLDRVGDIIADFHAKLPAERFTAMQKAARGAYRDHLRMDAFSKELAALLRGRLDTKA